MQLARCWGAASRVCKAGAAVAQRSPSARPPAALPAPRLRPLSFLAAGQGSTAYWGPPGPLAVTLQTRHCLVAKAVAYATAQLEPALSPVSLPAAAPGRPRRSGSLSSAGEQRRALVAARALPPLLDQAALPPACVPRLCRRWHASWRPHLRWSTATATAPSAGRMCAPSWRPLPTACWMLRRRRRWSGWRRLAAWSRCALRGPGGWAPGCSTACSMLHGLRAWGSGAFAVPSPPHHAWCQGRAPSPPLPFTRRRRWTQ